jgi:uncharacterized protein with NAD-binding domain and iron-sulfur cluster
MHTATNEKTKVAILGGGMAALTAAFELTARPELRERFEVTVYQLGWRLGGKGASGRNAAYAHRIEEHGLHILMGSYHNTFRVLRACYEELARPTEAPLATLDEAVKPHDLVVLADLVDGRWEPWPLRFPPIPGKPGEDAPAEPHPWGYLKQVVAWMYRFFTDAPEIHRLVPDLDECEADIDADLGRAHPAPVRAAASRMRGENASEARAAAASERGPVDPTRLIAVIDDLQRSEPAEGGRGSTNTRSPTVHATLLYLAHLLGESSVLDPGPRVAWLLKRFRGWLGHTVARAVAGSSPLRRLWTVLDLGLTAVIGAVTDGVDRAAEGWFSIDDHDLRAWLKKHGASDVACDSALVRAVYNIAFTAPGQAAAGTAMHGILKMALTYKEAVFQKMQAGMGDTIFAPLYLVLQKRGVKFAFFHRVDELVLSPDGKRIAAIAMGRQVALKGPAYEPLYDVGGLPCWPSAPRYEQIEGGEALRASGQNLESGWCTWPDAEARTLTAGRDFDAVVLGIAIGAFPTVCRQLVAAGGDFAKMVAHVKTTQTQAVQLWLRPDLRGLGWRLDSPVLDGFAEPFDTWADMSHLLPREVWPEGAAPHQIAYLCSRLEDDGTPPPPGTASAYPTQQKERVREHARRWLTHEAGKLWPGAVSSAGGGFDWSLLVDPEDREGARRLEAQYLQATWSPSERYVLSVPGSRRHRLRADASGYDNLVLAGDWVRTGMSAGCVEAAVMAGMQASRALSGHPRTIPGDDGEGGDHGP